MGSDVRDRLHDQLTQPGPPRLLASGDRRGGDCRGAGARSAPGGSAPVSVPVTPTGPPQGRSSSRRRSRCSSRVLAELLLDPRDRGSARRDQAGAGVRAAGSDAGDEGIPDHGAAGVLIDAPLHAAWVGVARAGQDALDDLAALRIAKAGRFFGAALRADAGRAIDGARAARRAPPCSRRSRRLPTRRCPPSLDRLRPRPPRRCRRRLPRIRPLLRRRSRLPSPSRRHRRCRTLIERRANLGTRFVS